MRIWSRQSQNSNSDALTNAQQLKQNRIWSYRSFVVCHDKTGVVHLGAGCRVPLGVAVLLSCVKTKQPLCSWRCSWGAGKSSWRSWQGVGGANQCKVMSRISHKCRGKNRSLARFSLGQNPVRRVIKNDRLFSRGDRARIQPAWGQAELAKSLFQVVPASHRTCCSNGLCCRPLSLYPLQPNSFCFYSMEVALCQTVL